MGDYTAVQKALKDGADPAMLCMTCPWDRNCVTPPTMTSAEIDAQVQGATTEDDLRAAERKAHGQESGLPTATLITIATLAGRDTAAQVCPVFALRLRGSGGRRIADGVRASMQSWDDTP